MNTSQLSRAGESPLATSVEGLSSKDPVLREKARHALIAVGTLAVVPLLQRLNDPADHVCWEAAKALGAIGDPAAASALADALDHPNHDVRWLAAEALIALGHDGLKQVLMALLTKAGSIGVQKSAHHVLSEFAERRSGDFLKPLLKKFDAFEPAVAIPPAALRTLHELQLRVPLI